MTAASPYRCYPASPVETVPLRGRSAKEEPDSTDRARPRPYGGGTTRYHRGTGQILMPMASGDDIK